MIIHR